METHHCDIALSSFPHLIPHSSLRIIIYSISPSLRVHPPLLVSYSTPNLCAWMNGSMCIGGLKANITYKDMHEIFVF